MRDDLTTLNNSSSNLPNPRHPLLVAATFLGLLALTWMVFQPAIPGFFMLDDFDNLGTLRPVNDIESLRGYLRDGQAGPLGRPISKLSFLLDDNAWPSQPGGFKRTNLLLHLLIGIVLFIAGRQMLRPFTSTAGADWLALTIMALWLVHPLQVSTVSYVVQRMTQLSTLFVVIGVALHLQLRLRNPNPNSRAMVWMTLSLGLSTLLAVLSKESGILLAVYLLVVEFTLLAHLPTNRAFIWWRRTFIVFPSVALVAYLAYLPRWIGSYQTRDFTLLERVITQPVVLLDYLSSLFSMRVSGLGLFHDDFPIYSSLLQPMALFSALVITVALIGAIRYRLHRPLLSFGALWFLGGHLLESTTVSLELYFEHRNYLPIFGPLLAATVAINNTLGKYTSDLRRLAPVLATIIIGITAATTWGYASEWGSLMRIIPIWAVEHPDSPRAQRTYAQTLVGAGLAGVALDELDEAYRRFPHDLSIPIMSIDIACRNNKPLRYHFSELASATPSHRMTDGLRPAMQSLFSGILTTSCHNQTADLHNLIPALFNLEDNELWHRSISGMYVLSGDLYRKQENPSGALTAYQIIDQIAPTAASAQRVANLYLLAQQFDDARQWLTVAQSREHAKQTWYHMSNNELYAEKFRMIDQMQSRRKATTATGLAQ
ncbi:MAG: hypothetical protein RRB22_01040 [Gammaproteobacteria bacterium]|nr:hypothetical protein [Gammaproteobacteria bacterium]